LSGYSTEGGEVTVYRDAKTDIRLIKVKLYFESGKVIGEYYYQNGSLIFAFYEAHHYNVPFYVTSETAKEIGSEAFDPKKTKISEDRYYFNNGKMIRWLDENNKEVNANSEEFKEAEKRITDFSNELATKFKRKT
jgi:antitoxin component YwqK of YwqJK toxin-antitoxin module